MPRSTFLGGEYPVHFAEQGVGRPVIMVHGNPTWGYLWRKVMQDLEDRRDLRLLVPDLVGFGLSGKPASATEHTLARHIEWLSAWFEAMDLKDVIMVGQDWGGPIATGVAARFPNRISGLVLANTAVLAPKKPVQTTAFHRLSHLPILSDLLFQLTRFPIPVMQFAQGNRGSMPARVRRAYTWPLRRFKDRAGPLALARMVPDSTDHASYPVLEDTEAWLRGFDGPVELVWGVQDPILGRAWYRLKQMWPGAGLVKTEAGHFLQEEVPAQLAAAIRKVAAA